MSKFLSLVLRHRPEEIDLHLEPGGWADLEALVQATSEAFGAPVDEERIRTLVARQSKTRFSISRDGERIRANYGHSLDVDLGLEPAVPPEDLYHGTAERFLESILGEGLRSGSRRHVHLGTTPADARAVGKRHGKPRILRIPAGRMHRQGQRFYRAADGIWLTDFVSPSSLELLDD